MTTIKCPNCGANKYMERYTTRTAMYFPPIYENGVNINPDRNISTHICLCMNCNEVFSYQERGGEIIA